MIAALNPAVHRPTGSGLRLAARGGRAGSSRLRLTFVVLVGLQLSGCSTLMSLQTQMASDATTPTDGLREALRVATARTVDLLGRPDGFLGSDLIRVPVPPQLDKLAKALRVVGAGEQVDEFVTSMNRAAEAAAPAAKEVFVDAIREMTFDDALAIINGEQHEATDYFREHAGPRLEELFRPIVADKLDAVGATRSFNKLMDEAAALPFVKRPPIDLTDYVTAEALDGLFLTIASEEEKIRTDPLARTTELLRKYFSS